MEWRRSFHGYAGSQEGGERKGLFCMPYNDTTQRNKNVIRNIQEHCLCHVIKAKST